MRREAFERELERLQNEMLAMARMVVHAIQTSVKSLEEHDMEAAERVVAADRAINKKRFAIESDCLVAIATQQPMAVDLRILAAVLHMVDELERIGDYAKGIGKINLRLGPSPSVTVPPEFGPMTKQVCSMLQRSLDAFVGRDVVAARAIPREDAEVDAMYERIGKAVIAQAAADPTRIEQAQYLLWVAHNLERSADRATNMCERLIFTATGELVELDDGEGFDVN